MSVQKKGVNIQQMDMYQRWERDGVLSQRLNAIRDYIRQGATLSSIAKSLNISEKTIYKMRDKYSDFRDCLDRGVGDLQETLFTSMTKKARGYSHVLTEKKYVVDADGVQRLVEVKERELHYPPDFTAIEYLLTIRCGITKQTSVKVELEGNYVDTITKALGIHKDKLDATIQED